MSIVLHRVLEAADLARVRAELGGLTWKGGKRTAGQTARQVKENLQADGDDPRTLALARFITDALQRHPLFEIAARPAKLSRILFSRYEPGMEYGPHTDDALMGAGEERLRTDLAFTLFLSEHGSYEGGALVIESALGEQSIELEAGDAFLYPAGSIHHVAPVSSGIRLAAVGWIQSHVASEAERETLFDLSMARARLAAAGAAREDLLRIDRSISNLLRMWAR